MSVPTVAYIVQSTFPPSFADNPWTYCAALFSMSMISLLSVGQIITIWHETRKDKLLGACVSLRYVSTEYIPGWSALSLYRIMMQLLYFTFFINTFPDVLVMLCWGEKGPGTMIVLFLIDRIGDAISLIPFTFAMGLSALLAQVIPQKLIAAGRGDLRREVKKPNWLAFLPVLKLAAVVLFISAGVTVGKAGWG